MESEKKVSIPTVLDAFLGRKDRFSLIDEELKIGQVLPPARILECGSGDGRGALHLHGLGYCVAAVDISSKHISPETAEKVNFTQADVCSLPFLDGSFDVIYSEAAFSVLKDKESAAKEYKRVLRRGGLVIINDFCYADKQSGTLPGLESYPGAAGAMTVGAYEDIFRAHGFEIVRSKELFTDFLKISASLSETYGVKGRELPAYLKELSGNTDEKKAFGGRFSYCMLMLRRKDN